MAFAAGPTLNRFAQISVPIATEPVIDGECFVTILHRGLVQRHGAKVEWRDQPCNRIMIDDRKFAIWLPGRG